jgi:hypothetical protein
MSPAILASRHRAAAIAWLAAVALAAGLYRHGRRLTFDGYYYCEFAKTYAHGWPQAFGNHWPCGYPLLGGLLGRLGLPAYDALCAVSLLALAVLVLIGNRLAVDLPRGGLAVIALAATPVIGVQLFGNLTELPFAAEMLGLAAALAAWQRRRTWGLAAACALLALSTRYAGVIAYGVLWIWLAAHAPALRRAGGFGPAAAAVVASTLAAAALLLWNLHATGYLSGAPREAAEGLGVAAWPGHVADLGWAPVAALMLGSLRTLAGGAGLAGRLVGWLLSLAGATVCVWAMLRPRLPWVRALAFVAFVYGAGMTVLRSAGSFDALHGARVFLPALFPLGLIAAAQCSGRWPRSVAAASVAVLAAGIVSSARGLSQEIAGDVRAAVPVLRPRLQPGDGVQINDSAFSLAAYLPQRTDRAWPASWREDAAHRFLVVAAAPLDRAGTPGPLAPAWQALAARLVAQGTHRRLLDTPALLILERTAGTVPP